MAKRPEHIYIVRYDDRMNENGEPVEIDLAKEPEFEVSVPAADAAAAANKVMCRLASDQGCPPSKISYVIREIALDRVLG